LKSKKNILFVSHDANRAGAQIFLYNIMTSLKGEGYGVVLLIINDWGTYKDVFESNFPTYYLTQHNKQETTFSRIKNKFIRDQNIFEQLNTRYTFDLVYANTIASVGILKYLTKHIKAPILTHIHELSYSISQFGQKHALHDLFKYSSSIIACSKAVKSNLVKSHPEAEYKIEVIHSFVNNQKILETHHQSNPENKRLLRQKYGLEENVFLVGSCGNADWRKAPDLFCQIAKHSCLNKSSNIHFLWIGIEPESELLRQLKFDAEKMGITNNITWIPPTPDAIQIINLLDVFLVCSREDPFPLVMLEAALCQKPILGFKDTGGAEEFIENHCGYLANYADSAQLAAYILDLKENVSLKDKFGEQAQKNVMDLYNFENSIKKIKKLMDSASNK
jgi:glycosyltransferase involved in cell wall biosynthesis